MKILRKQILTYALLFGVLAAVAKTGKLFTTDSYLSSSMVNDVYQDRDGIIWIGTGNGLFCLDIATGRISDWSSLPGKDNITN